jgi:transposase
VRVRAERRRPWPDEDKLRIVRETLVSGAVVQAVAGRHGVSTGQLYTWRKQEAGHGDVRLHPARGSPGGAACTAIDAGGRDRITDRHGDLQVMLPRGAELRFSGTLTPGLLREVLAALGRR